MTGRQCRKLGSPFRGELSAKLTEGVRQSEIDSRTNGSEFMVNLCVCKPQHTKTLFGHKGVSPSVVFQSIRLKVAATVQFNDQLGGSTIEICDVGAKGLLAAKMSRMSAQKQIPQFSLLWSHITA